MTLDISGLEYTFIITGCLACRNRDIFRSLVEVSYSEREREEVGGERSGEREKK